MQASIRNVTLFWIRELLKNGLKINVKVHEDFNLFNFSVLIYKIWKKKYYTYLVFVHRLLQKIQELHLLRIWGRGSLTDSVVSLPPGTLAEVVRLVFRWGTVGTTMNGSSPSVNSPQGMRARVQADPAPVYSPSSLPSASKSDTVARAISH